MGHCGVRCAAYRCCRCRGVLHISCSVLAASLSSAPTDGPCLTATVRRRLHQWPQCNGPGCLVSRLMRLDLPHRWRTVGRAAPTTRPGSRL